MKRFIYTIAIILGGFLLLDNILGNSFDYFFPKYKHVSSETSEFYYNANKANAEVIIMGASRAARHYNPRMIGDSIKLKTIDEATDGTGSLFHCCILHRIVRRHVPQIVIYEYPEYLLNGTYVAKDLARIKCFYNQDEYAKAVIDRVSKWDEPYKLLFNLYRLNPTLSKSINSLFSSESTTNGYYPLEIPEIYPSVNYNNKEINKVDKDELYCLNQIFNMSKEYGFELIIVDSPTLNKNNKSKILSNLCKRNHVPFINNNYVFNNDSTLFRDRNHLNKIGSEKYTQLFIKQLKPLIGKN